MRCPACFTQNDSDALFCSECGRRLTTGLLSVSGENKRAYLFLLVLIPALAMIAWLGYYKFILPSGVAAVVDGEEIKRAELDAAAPRSQGMEEAAYRNFRYQTLNALILERIVLQKARTTGIRVSREELSSAVATAKATSGLDDAGFSREIASQYGSEKSFVDALERRLMIEKLFSEKIVPRGSDPQTAHLIVNRWIQKETEQAAVRIDLSEEVSGASCGCCYGGGTAAEGSLALEQEKIARDAGLAYWREKYGSDVVTAQLKDYGCHMQIDIVKNKKIVKSLRYQGGIITEM